MESIFAELASAGLVRPPAGVTLEDYLGSERLALEAELPGMPGQQPADPPANKAKTGGKKANVAPKPPPGKTPGTKGKPGGAAGAAGGGEDAQLKIPESSMAQARQAVTAACVLPLGAHKALTR